MIVYKITNVFYGTSYIGQTVGSLQSQWRDHISSAARGSKFYFHNAIRKYGPDAFSVEVLQECESREEMDLVETLYIDLLCTKAPDGYNLTLGGGGTKSFKHSESAKIRIGEAAKGNQYSAGKKRSEESIQRMIAAQRKSWDSRGWHISEETKYKISKANKGKKRTEEAKKKMSVAKKAYYEREKLHGK